MPEKKTSFRWNKFRIGFLKDLYFSLKNEQDLTVKLVTYSRFVYRKKYWWIIESFSDTIFFIRFQVEARLLFTIKSRFYGIGHQLQQWSTHAECSQGTIFGHVQGKFLAFSKNNCVILFKKYQKNFKKRLEYLVSLGLLLFYRRTIVRR